ncbi:hypothetical protein Rhe02_31070 [Rhizocola hellebori]|uniref:Lipoprotein LpqB n=1 Tax=Rhizocola hellebori TaxID=1392758 RepID=A0A8J3Q736_9ACTN|nr:hypothetical protein [Rhizocola hellebori]GIH05040.1 hypothetical protein Rhe02_31070 [Rhizocola hellebori]
MRIVRLVLAAALVTSIAACTATKSDGTRPLTKAELNRLASMRMHNYSDGRTGITGTIGAPGKQTSVSGWVDWQRAVIYLSAYAAGSSVLVQAKPGVVALRPGDPKAPISGPPPLQPPADGWRVKPIALSGDQKAPLDNLLAFLFLVARDQPDRTDLLSPLKNQWIRKDSAQGTDVDVLLGPALMPESELAGTPSPSPSPDPSPDPSASPAKPLDPADLDAHGGAVGYWLDANGRMRRVEAVLAEGMPTTIDFVREDKPDFTVIDALGGRDISPREVSDPEATLLSALRQRNYRANTASVAVTLPVAKGALRKARGWLDWQRGLIYLSVQDVDDPTYDVLLHASRTAVAIRKHGSRAPDTPTLPAPKGGWEKVAWSELSGTPELTELDMLVYEALSMGANQLDDAKRIKAGARRLRVDVLNGVPVGVFELPGVVEQQLTAPGQARLRYWVDNSGVLRRLEIRIATGGFAQLDLELGVKLPSLPSSVS